MLRRRGEETVQIVQDYGSVCLRVCRPAREPQTGKPPKVLPRVLSGVLSEIGVLPPVLPESALEGALPVVFHRRALLGALLTAPRFLRALPTALSGALFNVRLFNLNLTSAPQGNSNHGLEWFARVPNSPSHTHQCSRECSRRCSSCCTPGVNSWELGSTFGGLPVLGSLSRSTDSQRYI